MRTAEADDLHDLVRDLRSRVPIDAAALLADQPPARVEAALARLPPAFARRIRAEMSGAEGGIEAPAGGVTRVGQLMEPPTGVVAESLTVAEAVAWLSQVESPGEITYFYCVDAAQRLTGMVVMRDLLLATPEQPLSSVMLHEPFCLAPDLSIKEAVDCAVHRHYPVYPVCDTEGKVVGLLRGWRLFERHVVEISAQPGTMVGLDKEERLATPLGAVLRKRHPWLQLNLLTAFGTAFVVSLFDATIEQVVVLAAFLPVLSCLAGNNGCQALAITLRGLTLGEVGEGSIRRLLSKEALVGTLNGVGTGLLAAVAMMAFAWLLGSEGVLALGIIMWISMALMCMFSGLLGSLVPLMLKRFGADPATASSIFVLTVTDIVGMALMLSLATVFVL